MSFVHLHLHTQFSLLDGACKIPDVLQGAAELSQNALAITDHGNMFGVIEFYKEAKKRGIKPIIGCEVYVAKRSRFDKQHPIDSEIYHLVLLCENNDGYSNLMALVSKAWTEGFYNKPRVDRQLLKKHSKGIIALSACMAGEIPRAIERDDYKAAREAALFYKDTFGEDNFFLEIQYHNLPKQAQINAGILRLSNELDIPLVATNDCHYVSPSDSQMHKVLMCIQTVRTLNDPNLLDFGSEEFYLKSENEMRALFKDFPNAIENTQKIADRCNVEIEFGKIRLPEFDAPNGETSNSYFRRLCTEGMHRIYGNTPDESVLQRLKYETSVIENMGYVDYFLIVADYVSFAKNSGIPVGPGRGSGAGSLAAYCLGITNIDPMRYNLIFERFLNPERISMPDFDVDFSDERRQEVINYVISKYGKERVSQIIAFDTMAARGAIRDAGRAMGISYQKVDKVAKQIPRMLKITIDEILNAKQGDAAYCAEFTALYKSDPETTNLIDMAKKLEGMPRHATTHAAGVVICDKNVNNYVPLAKNDEAIVTQYPMAQLEEIGLVKMDFLGLRNLSVIDNAIKLINKKDPNFDINTIPDNDKETFALISNANTKGVFQLESEGMKRLLKKAQPQSLEDLTAIISLYRPGPMSFIPDYIKNRKAPDKIKYLHPLLKPILEVTYGCIIYQEQVMEICRSLAGYSMGRADLVRRVMSKKKTLEMENERKNFIYGLTNEKGEILVQGCIRRGVPKETASKLFSEMSSFASYAFNKSHAAAYSVVAYQTAYLKCHYKGEYMASLLTSVLHDSAKVTDYISECQSHGVKLLPPHVNKSEEGFSVEGKNIRFGLLAVRNLGRVLISSLVKERNENGKFTDLYSFCKRLYGNDLNKKALESLIKCGALDNLGNNRREMAYASAAVLDAASQEASRTSYGQIGFFDLPQIKKDDIFRINKMPDVSVSEKIAMEKEVTGIYLSGHPLDKYKDLINIKITPFSALSQDGNLKDGAYVNILGVVESIQEKQTKTMKAMAFVFMEDLTAKAEVLVFPDLFDKTGELLSEGAVLLISGRVSVNDDKPSNILASKIENVHIDVNKKKSSRQGLYLKLKSENDPLFKKALKLLSNFGGNTALYLYFEDTKSLKKAPPTKFVGVNSALINELSNLLGEKNVALVEPLD